MNSFVQADFVNVVDVVAGTVHRLVIVHRLASLEPRLRINLIIRG